MATRRAKAQLAEEMQAKRQAQPSKAASLSNIVHENKRRKSMPDSGDGNEYAKGEHPNSRKNLKSTKNIKPLPNEEEGDEDEDEDENEQEEENENEDEDEKEDEEEEDEDDNLDPRIVVMDYNVKSKGPDAFLRVTISGQGVTHAKRKVPVDNWTNRHTGAEWALDHVTKRSRCVLLATIGPVYNVIYGWLAGHANREDLVIQELISFTEQHFTSVMKNLRTKFHLSRYDATIGKASIRQGKYSVKQTGDQVSICYSPHTMVRAGPGRSRALRVSQRKSTRHGVCVWARRALNGRTRRPPARAESVRAVRAERAGLPRCPGRRSRGPGPAGAVKRPDRFPSKIVFPCEEKKKRFG